MKNSRRFDQPSACGTLFLLCSCIADSIGAMSAMTRTSTVADRRYRKRRLGWQPKRTRQRHVLPRSIAVADTDRHYNTSASCSQETATADVYLMTGTLLLRDLSTRQR